MRSTFAGPGQSTDKKYKATLDPGRSMPSTAAGSPGNFYSQSKDVIGEVPKGTQLKPAQTVDKSKPLIAPDTKVKKVDRKPFLAEVSKDHELAHVDAPADRSDPKIDADVHVKQNDRGAFLHAVEEKAKEKGTAVEDV